MWKRKNFRASSSTEKGPLPHSWRQPQILDVHQLIPRIPEITQVPLELSFLPRDRDSSPLLQLFLANLSFSLPTLSPFLEFCEMPSQYPQNTCKTFSFYPYIPLAFFILSIFLFFIYNFFLPFSLKPSLPSFPLMHLPPSISFFMNFTSVKMLFGYW